MGKARGKDLGLCIGPRFSGVAQAPAALLGGTPPASGRLE